MNGDSEKSNEDKELMFKNEYISKDDVKKYKVDEMWASMRPVSRKLQKIDPDFPYSWMVDKETETFFIPARSGYEEDSNQKWCIFWFKNTRFTIVIRSHGYMTKTDGKWGVRWNLEKILKPQGCLIDHNELLPVLEEALIVFGYDGIFRQYYDYIVEFDYKGEYRNDYYSE